MSVAKVIPLTHESNLMNNVKKGHVVLHRSTLNDDDLMCPIAFTLWSKIIMMASFKSRIQSFDGKNWELKAGQLVTTYSILGRMIKLKGKETSKEEIRNIIRKFKASGKITTEKSNNSVVITIENYAKYQSDFFTAPSTAPSTAPVTAEEANNDNGLGVVNSSPITAPSTVLVTAQNNTLLNNTLDNNIKHMSSDDDEQVKSKPKNQKAKYDYQSIIEAYRDVVLDGLPVPEEINAKRKTLINKLAPKLKNSDASTFKAYFARFMDLIENNSFYFGGENGRAWKATFDYVLRLDTLTKVKEDAL